MDRTREQLIDDIHGMALELEEKDKRIAELEYENKRLRAGLKNIAQNTKSFENSQNGNDWYLSIVYHIAISLLDNEEK